MRNTFKNFSNHSVWIGFVILILLLLISFEIKHKDFKQVTGSQNLEATYHTILTIKAFKSSPIENHWYLPTVTLGKNEDKYIPWGATVPTKTGDYIYTSFTSPGFLAPYLAFELFNLEPSEKNLAYFNFLLGSAVSLILFIFLLKILEYSGYSRRVAVGGAVLGTVVSIFSKESLQSHGLVYWSQSFFQLILISALCFLFMYLVNKNNSKKYTICLIVSVFLGAWTEWSGYVFGVGLAALFWFGVLIERPKKILSLQLIATMVVAGLLTLLHYGLAVGFDPAIKAFIGRFLARNTASGNLIDLLDGYALSFGFFILITCAALIPSFFSIDSNQKENAETKKKLAFLFFAASIPLVENFIMLQHATQFSFDRLKFIFPAALIISLSFARCSNFYRLVLSLALVFASFQGYKSYKTDLFNYSSWAAVDIENKALLNLISKKANIDCSVLLSNIGVRGYANNLLNRGIYEHKTKNDSIALMKQRGACSAIYFQGKWAFPDLPHYDQALITNPDGSTIQLEINATEK